MTGSSSSTKSNNQQQQPSIISKELRDQIFQRTLPGLMLAMLLLFLIGRAIGSICYKSSPFLHRKLQSMPSYTAACYFIAVIVPMLFVNWGWGIYHREWFLFVRFVTAAISGMLMTWAKRQPFFYSDSGKGGKKGHDDDEIMNNEAIDMEEGRIRDDIDDNNKGGMVVEASKGREQQWIDWYWIAGAGCSSLLGGYIFYPLNRLMMALEPIILVPLSLIVVGILVHRQLSRYLSAISASPSSNKVDRTVFGGGDSNDMGTVVKQSSSSSMIQRRKQISNLEKQQPQQEELYDGKSHARSRLYSDDSDDQFFDCLDEIELGPSEEPESSINNDDGKSSSAAINYDRQIATYSRRKVRYSDGTDAYVPANESISSIPPGYLSMHNNNQVKSQTKYEATQQWRRSERIHCIHSRHHAWFHKIKAAYPHVIHGFTPDGMPVVYEAPGKMNLKELLRNGCHVKDMIFHYCYMMEYLSNIESVLSEVNANELNQDWQEPLAAYAHAKQMRLQNDTVPFGFVVVMDISGATPSSLSSDVMTYLKQAGDINSSHYPGSMRRAILVQAPFWLGSMWKAVKGILPSSVTTDLLSGSQTMNGGLKQYIAEDQIPVEYGGTSPFKLGEHPFEIGFKKLAESQADEVDAGSMTSHYSRSSPYAPLREDSPPRQSNRPQSQQQDNNIVVSRQALSNTAPIKRDTLPQGWDGLGASYILVVASLLQLCSYAVMGSIELSMPLWVISPDGMGYESRRTGLACFGACFIVLQTLKQVKPHLSLQSIQKNPSRNVRMGISASCLSLAFINLIPMTSNHDKSFLGLVFLSTLGAFVYLGLVLGVMSVDHLRATAISSSNDSSGLPSGLAFMQSHKSSPVLVILGRVVGYICFIAIYLGSGTWFLAAYCAITACILTSFLL